MTSPLLRPDGRPWTAQDVNDLHKYADKDRDADALHHTLGTRKTQAAPGDHGHVEFFPDSTGRYHFYSKSGIAAGLELGDTQDGPLAGVSYIDFHSSGNDNDYDVRMLASGGAAGTGQGTLTLSALLMLLGSTTLRSNTNIEAGAQSGTTGRTVMNAGYAGSSGFIGFFDGSAHRQGFIGDSGTTAVGPDAGTLKYRAGTHDFGGTVQNTTGEFVSKRGNNLVESNSGHTKVQAGTTSFSGTAVNVIGPTTITFPEAFTGTPRVVATISGLPGGANKWIPKHTNKGTTSFDLYVYTGDGLNATVTSMPVEWIAVGPA